MPTLRSRKALPRLIGVIHLPALPGAPRAWGRSAPDALDRAGAWAIAEARALERAGFEAVLIENFGDAPFYKDQVPAETIAALAVICAAVRESVKIPVGVNVLRNDGASALAIAAVTGCDFMRVNVLTGAAATDQGIVEGQGATLLRERQRLLTDVRILADVQVKHARTLHTDDLALSVEDTAGRGLADGVIVTGSTTGRLATEEALEQAGMAARHAEVPLYVGSGSTAENLPTVLRWADGVIVGSALRKGGVAGQALDASRLRKFVAAYRAAKSRPAKKKRVGRSGR
ncbi:MAG: BtpA/SgcQ family protein [Bdellovibrionales bacterium]|nr:BtpA/SgcQ family protein [Bdellovibrionales bacterium]